MGLFLWLLCAALWSVSVAWFLQRTVFSSRTLKLPPGPVRKWIIGNFLDIPTEAGWLVYKNWQKQYGDIISLKALGNTVVVLNSLDVIKDLLEKRGNNYSDRVVLTMAGEMIGLDQSIGLLGYGTTLRTHKKLTNKFLSPESVKKYHSVQERLTVMYLRSLLDKPGDFNDQLRLTTGGIIMGAIYGLSVDATDTLADYVSEVEETMQLINRATTPGAYLVDLLPVLKHIPHWFPFASFKKIAAYGRNQVLGCITRPFDYVKAEMAAGTARPSFTSEALADSMSDTGKISPEMEDIIRWGAGSMYGAGAETTYAVVLSFIFAMVLYPDVQRKAQAEIDNILGSDRLPNIHDRPSLPYVEAVIKETMRWNVTLPLGIPHRTSTDDIYNGYFIPAGSIIIPNVWSIAYDETTYKSPHEFRPERFLEGDALDSDVFGFGFGRRICPGRYLGSNSSFFLISSILATFNISKAHEEVPLENIDFTTGLIRYPKHFKCHIEPRSAAKTRIIREMDEVCI